MTEETALSKDTFLCIAEASGLNPRDPHMDELYSYVQNALPPLRSLDGLDLNGLEPTMPLLTAKEWLP